MFVRNFMSTAHKLDMTDPQQYVYLSLQFMALDDEIVKPWDVGAAVNDANSKNAFRPVVQVLRLLNLFFGEVLGYNR